MSKIKTLNKMYRKIYRLENSKGEGLFTAEDLSLYNCDAYFTSDRKVVERHPTPEQDELLYEGIKSVFGGSKGDYGEYRFGFSTKAQLRCWFYSNRWLKWMAKNGYKLCIYTVEKKNVLVGHTQAIFIPSDVEPEKYCIKEYFKLGE